MGGANEISVCAMHRCVYAHDRMAKFNVSKFHCAKNLQKIFHQ